MDEYITLADGTVVQNAYVVKIEDDRIAVYVEGQHTFEEISSLFSKKTKTKKMESNQFGDIKQWLGFTELMSLVINSNDASVTLRKPL